MILFSVYTWFLNKEKNAKKETGAIDLFLSYFIISFTGYVTCKAAVLSSANAAFFQQLQTAVRIV